DRTGARPARFVQRLLPLPAGSRWPPRRAVYGGLSDGGPGLEADPLAHQRSAPANLLGTGGSRQLVPGGDSGCVGEGRKDDAPCGYGAVATQAPLPRLTWNNGSRDAIFRFVSRRLGAIGGKSPFPALDHSLDAFFSDIFSNYFVIFRRRDGYARDG